MLQSNNTHKSQNNLLDVMFLEKTLSETFNLYEGGKVLEKDSFIKTLSRALQALIEAQDEEVQKALVLYNDEKKPTITQRIARYLHRTTDKTENKTLESKIKTACDNAANLYYGMLEFEARHLKQLQIESQKLHHLKEFLVESKKWLQNLPQPSPLSSELLEKLSKKITSLERKLKQLSEDRPEIILGRLDPDMYKSSTSQKIARAWKFLKGKLRLSDTGPMSFIDKGVIDNFNVITSINGEIKCKELTLEKIDPRVPLLINMRFDEWSPLVNAILIKGVRDFGFDCQLATDPTHKRAIPSFNSTNPNLSVFASEISTLMIGKYDAHRTKHACVLNAPHSTSNSVDLKENTTLAQMYIPQQQIMLSEIPISQSETLKQAISALFAQPQDLHLEQSEPV